MGNVDQLNLAAAGLAADDRGRIAVERRLPHHPAPHLCRRRCDWISRVSRRCPWSRGESRPPRPRARPAVEPRHYPYGIYTIPEISFIGRTEEQLTEDDVPYEVGLAYYSEIARGQIRGDTTGG